jgi:hypothetical protein
MARLTPGAIEPLLEDAVLGFEFNDAGFEFQFTPLAGVKQGAVIASLLACLKELGAIRAVGARKRSKRVKEVGAASRRRLGVGRRQGSSRCRDRGSCRGGRSDPLCPGFGWLFVIGGDHTP